MHQETGGHAPVGVHRGFTKFNNARQFAAYRKIAPCPHQSGGSISGK
ncbi:transposase [Flagellimonas sp.]